MHHYITNLVFQDILQFTSLFVPYEVVKYEIKYQYEDGILKLQAPLIYLISDGTAETKLGILVFFYCAEFLNSTKLSLVFFLVCCKPISSNILTIYEKPETSLYSQKVNLHSVSNKKC